MENTPTGHADDLPTFFGIFQKGSKIEKCQHFFQRLDFAPNSIKDFIYQPKLRPAKCMELALHLIIERFLTPYPYLPWGQ